MFKLKWQHSTTQRLIQVKGRSFFSPVRKLKKRGESQVIMSESQQRKTTHCLLNKITKTVGNLVQEKSTCYITCVDELIRLQEHPNLMWMFDTNVPWRSLRQFSCIRTRAQADDRLSGDWDIRWSSHFEAFGASWQCWLIDIWVLAGRAFPFQSDKACFELWLQSSYQTLHWALAALK
jgi:hypothetical protein